MNKKLKEYALQIEEILARKFPDKPLEELITL